MTGRLLAAFRPFLAVDTVFMPPSSFRDAFADLGGRWRPSRVDGGQVSRYVTQVMNQGTTKGAGPLREMAGLDEAAPLFVQVAERLAEEIADGTLADGERVPSTNELAAYYRINPATAAKGISMLTDDGLLDKRRGIGMFVASGARARLLGERRGRFAQRYVQPLVAEADRLGIDADELVALIRESSCVQEGTRP